MIQSYRQGDNNWVSLEMLADKQTFVGTTDTNVKLEIDINTLDAMDWIQWDDKLNLMTGVSHSQTHSDGSVISIGMSIDYLTMSTKLLLYKMSPTDYLNRQVIASIPADKTYFLHSFALTENYAVIFLPPVYYEGMPQAMIFGKQIQDIFRQDLEASTKIVVVRLKDGKIKNFDPKAFMFLAHFSQSYERSNGEIVVEVPTSGNANLFIDFFLRENYQKLEEMSNPVPGSTLNRFTFDFDKGTMRIKPLLSVPHGNIDLPQFNRNPKD